MTVPKGAMRQIWRLVPCLRLLGQHGLSASQFHAFASIRSFWKPAIQQPDSSRLAPWAPLPITPLHQMEQRRPYASKVKKYKIKSYSSYKERFKEKASGEYKRWRAGKRHNAHSKTNKQLRQLRRPSVVHAAYATVMKKLNFHG